MSEKKKPLYELENVDSQREMTPASVYRRLEHKTTQQYSKNQNEDIQDHSECKDWEQNRLRNHSEPEKCDSLCEDNARLPGTDCRMDHE